MVEIRSHRSGFWGSAPSAICVARVVIVDDSLLIRTQLRTIFSDGQFEVIGEAEDGLEAPGRVRKLRPDLVTLDLVMPGRDGLTTLEHLLMVDPGLAVIVCSASLDERRVIAALRLGAKGFITKPFDRDTVLDTAREALRGSIENDREPPATARVSARDLHRVCRVLAGELRDVLENAVDSGRVTLDQLLALDYQELTGSSIKRLQRQFDVSRVPAHGFDPPKFLTEYGSLVDRQMTERMDAVLAAEPYLGFAVPLDLNVYVPAHNSVFSCDCTGDPERDLILNRTKRFFLDSAALTRAARMELGVELPQRKLSRSEIERAGARVNEPVGEADTFLLQPYKRDTGALLNTLSVPLHVKGKRFGAVTLGWGPERP